MSIANNISNFWSTFWHLHPVSHINEDGSVKTMEQYSQEYEIEIKGKLFYEHVELIAKSKQGSSFVKMMNKVGKFLSGKYTFDNFSQDLGGKVLISPIDHYNKNGVLKTAAQYEADLRDEKANSCVYHQTLIEYDNSNYFELSCNTLGEMVSDMFNGKVFNALVSGTRLAGYSTGFLLHDVAYNQSYALIKSGFNLGIDIANTLNQAITSTKVNDSDKLETLQAEVDLSSLPMQDNVSLESYETLFDNSEISLNGAHSFMDFVAITS